MRPKSPFIRQILPAVLAFVLSAGAARAQFDPFALNTNKEPVTVSLVSEKSTIAPGETFTVAWKFELSETWHTYWLNSGSIELSFKIEEWTMPDGFEAGPVVFPVPERKEGVDYEEKTIVHYQYSDETYYFAEITAPDDLPDGEVTIGVAAGWQQCGVFPGEDTVVCQPVSKEFSISLKTGSESVDNESVKAVFDEYRKSKLPKPLEGWKVDAYSNPQGVQLVIRPDSDGANTKPGEIHFFPEARDFVVETKKQKVVEQEGAFVVQLRNDPEAEETPATLKGILWAENGWSAGGGASAFNVDLELIKGQPPVAQVSASGQGSKSLPAILVAALIGGLILNLMPCVFPVIGLKIMGFVNQAGEDRKKVTLHGLVFAAGVLVSFWVLAGVFLYLKLQGQEKGWGFQLQEPWFVYVLVLVMLILALNMAGVFEIGTSAVGVGSNLTSKGGLSGTFFSGVLATVVATPCSAPFLGTALGAVASLPPIPFFATFTCIALGLSLPYIVLSMFPDLVKKLPKPGAWMESFKQGMSFLLFGTAGYLYWTLSAQVENSLALVLSLAVIGMAFWIYGRWNTPVKSKPIRIRAIVIAFLLFAGAVYVGKPEVAAAGGDDDTLALNWETWSPEKVEELRAEGKSVYIDFTARWCATCQTNKISYKSEDVKQMIKDRNVVLLKASWDKPDDRIRKAINSYGKGAIPVNVLYIPGVDEPEVLPELLTSGVVKEYLEKIPEPEPEPAAE